jgi:hypothetical protein
LLLQGARLQTPLRQRKRQSSERLLLTARLSFYRRRLIQAEERAKPVADSLLVAYTAFLIVKAEFDAGETSEQQFAIASKELNSWISELAPLMNELIRNIKGAQ